MKVLAVITARGNSQGLPNKNILKLAGFPVIAYTIQAARESRFINRIFCSSDSSSILNCAASYGIEGIKRPRRFALHTSPIEEALTHSLSCFKEEQYVPDTLVLLYANVPFRRPGLIDDAIRMFLREKADAVVSVSPTERFHPERLAMVGRKNAFIPYTKEYSTFRRQELTQVYFIDSGVIVMKPGLLFGRDKLIISHYFKGRKVLALASKELGAWDIDNGFDLKLARLILTHTGHCPMLI